VNASDDELGGAELPVEVAAAVTGAVVVVVDGAVVVVVVDESGVVARGVTVHQEVNVAGVPGAAVNSGEPSTPGSYSQAAWTLTDWGDPMHEDGKLKPYSCVVRSNDTTTPEV
jgi:hypothetical protein